MHDVRILVVDDDPGLLAACDEILRGIPHAHVVTEQDPARARDRLTSGSWELLITDLSGSRADRLSVLRQAWQHDPELPVLILSASPSADSAVEGMKPGAADYLPKPFLPDDLLLAVRRLLELRRLREENRLLRRHVERGYAFDEMIGQSEVMQRVFDAIERVASTDIDVLITGETGTGKELVARSIHRRSARCQGRFVPVDCGAIPEDLLESELFGHERGAFTGAHAKSLGLLEFANRGTFFMDEVTHLSSKLQAKLLRALQERRVRRVGGTHEIDTDVRVLAATSLDIQAEVSTQRFRLDLFYRINVVRIDLPPLRARVEDIPILVDHFATRYAREMGRDEVAFDASALEVLCGYQWPGNIRELQNVLKRAIAMGRRPGTLSADDLPETLVTAAVAAPRGTATTPSFFDLRAQHIDAFEKDYFRRLLHGCRGNISQAAAQSRLPRGTLYRILARHGLDPAQFRE
jgi:two-component system, NtrC family, response regulator PilR